MVLKHAPMTFSQKHYIREKTRRKGTWGQSVKVTMVGTPEVNPILGGLYTNAFIEMHLIVCKEIV